MHGIWLLQLLLLAVGALCSSLHSHTLFKIREFESFIPQSMARNLLSNTDKSQWSRNPDNTFTKYFLQRGNRTDEYLCSIPSAAIESIEETEARRAGEEEDAASDAKLLDLAVDIIKDSFSKDECLFAYDLRRQYWTYAYCYADKVIQYHEVVPPHERRTKHIAAFPEIVFVLGRFTDSSVKSVEIRNQAEQKHKDLYERYGRGSFQLNDDKASPFSHHSAQKVISQVVDAGSFCEIASKPRQVEIIYKCDADAHGFGQPQILDVPEITTCQYRMMIHIPGLCALEPFAPYRNIKESSVDLSCQLLDRAENRTEVPELQTFEDYASNVKLRDDSIFPVRSDNRISVEDHSLMSLGFGFYLAKSKSRYSSTSAYYNNRNVVIYNGFDTSLEAIGSQLGRAVYNAIGKSLLAPYFENDEQRKLEWVDSFTVWLEVYDFFGEFIALLRVARNGEEREKRISVQMIDPVTMLDVEGAEAEGMAFDTAEYEAPHNLWNYQYFRRGGIRAHQHLPKKASKKQRPNLEEPEVQTVTKREVVTVTVSETVEKTFEPEAIMEDLSYDQDDSQLYFEDEYGEEIWEEVLDDNGGYHDDAY